MCSNQLFHMCGNMLLYKYFAVKDKLPRPTGPLFCDSSLANVAANEEGTKVMDSEKEKIMKNCKRGEHAKYSPAVKIELVKHAAQH